MALSDEQKQLMAQAAQEIRELRRDNRIMHEKLALVEGLLELRTLIQPQTPTTEEIDITHRLDHELYRNNVFKDNKERETGSGT